MLTVLTFRWGVAYGEADVRRLREQCAAHLPAHRFVCMEEPLPPFDTEYPHSCLQKLRAFEPGAFSGRVLQLDLDCDVVGDLRPLLTRDESFIAAKGHLPGLYYYSWTMLYYPERFHFLWTSLSKEAIEESVIQIDDGWISWRLGPSFGTFSVGDGVVNDFELPACYGPVRIIHKNQSRRRESPKELRLAVSKHRRIPAKGAG